eukprot:CAMPEP_0185599172 /NCGR_PEP_ID=MMETSP0434-20130131/82512_1 /TAXON_ID=626734 ORGANISM="Favella taraikaensis, Strain Fe Narragansett Bay" /NCGR_SAMPLE_ID=MMETSP0434 /ASSEMBLY_ACC=CAM_ASM_000379 /LENGTH=73 /DNA_ID=CAMNT_0028228453 /DNA_START=1750 /DNA_END=1971 /DNA_ORIENTATION=-
MKGTEELRIQEMSNQMDELDRESQRDRLVFYNPNQSSLEDLSEQLKDISEFDIDEDLEAVDSGSDGLGSRQDH